MSKLILYAKLIRLDRPIGVLVILWSTLIALWLAQQGMPTTKLIIIFSIGAFCVRCAACIVNDLCDYKFDSQVNRTATRPLATGAVSKLEAVAILILLLIMCLGLVLQLNVTSLYVAVIAILSISVYPLFKRFYRYPQLFLAFAINFGIPIAYVATIETIDSTAVMLWIICGLWTFIYDSEYAVTDMEDDRKLGLQSSALSLGASLWQTLLLCRIGVAIGIVTIGIANNFSLHYYWQIAPAIALLFWQSYQTKNAPPKNYFNAFKHSHFVMLLWLLAIWPQYAS